MRPIRARQNLPKQTGIRAGFAAFACVVLVSIGGVAIAATPEVSQSGSQSADEQVNDEARDPGTNEVLGEQSDESSTPEDSNVEQNDGTGQQGLGDVAEELPESDPSRDSLAEVAQLAAGGYQPVCEAGYVYAIGGTGQLQQVDPKGNKTDIGTKAKNVSGFNGLGIGTGGEPVYAYERTNSSKTATMWQFDTSAGQWRSLWDSYDTSKSENGEFQGALVAGAVNLAGGKFLFGGFETRQSGWFGSYTQVFKLWQYDPIGTPKFTYRGYLDLYSGWSDPGSGNGDIAFNSNGDLFVVKGNGTQTTIYSVTAASLNAADGGAIPFSRSNQFTTMNNVNGTAFDSGGLGYLGSASDLRGYKQPSWTESVKYDNRLKASTDLASCGSPPTMTVEKFVDGKRVNETDQFTLTLKQGSNSIGSVTTTGSKTGLQAERVGPVPVTRGVDLTFSETNAGTTNLEDYVSSYRCLVDGVQKSEGNGTLGTIKIGPSEKSVLCTFHNAPLVAKVTINKTLVDSEGNVMGPGENWTVGASATASSGTVIPDPGVSELTTDSNGSAAWSFKFNKKDAKASLEVAETEQEGYSFKSGECTITRLDGTTTSHPLPSAGKEFIGTISPGDTVACNYVNQEIPDPKLALIKKVNNPENGAGYAQATDWTLSATNTNDPTKKVEGPTGITRSVPAGSYVLTEGYAEDPDLSSGYDWTSLECVNDNSNEPFDATVEKADGVVSTAKVVLARGQEVTCTYTNTPKPGSVTWSKVGSDTSQVLEGSEWELSGPLTGSPVTVVDNTGQPEYDGADRDPAAGKFKVEDLVWGAYELKETKAPAGYYPKTDPIVFTIGASGENAKLEVDLGKIENTPVVSPDLPLTGGLGRDAFFMAGAGVVLLGAAGLTWTRRRKSRKEVA